ncbi:hypothetical protein ACIA8K_29780 [Catenuloplanes sp. NPDC051500]|uniref:hypothetical protein n=1 Tax=Catenuloplanes sp. NPDC051500 TaxID=3363959 RepID=UPI00378CD139
MDITAHTPEAEQPDPVAGQNGAHALSARASGRVVRAEQRRIDADAELERRAKTARLTIELRQERRAAARRERQIRDKERRDRTERRRVRRRAVWARMPRAAERALFVLPILFPMAVAWAGQIQFATQVMGWSTAGAVVFAAGFELSTAYVARLDWLSRAAGDGGVLFRAATWAFAAGAAVMNYWHAAGPGFAPTGEAVSYGLMSMTGVVLWELWSIFKHRQAMRAEGRLTAVRPRFGAARWLHFRGMTHLAWLIALRDGHTTTRSAWQAAFTAVKAFGTVRAARKAIRRGAQIPERANKPSIPPRISVAAETANAAAIAAPPKPPQPNGQLVLTWHEPADTPKPPVVATLPPPSAPAPTPAEKKSPVAVGTQMETFARERLAAGDKLSGAALDRQFGTHDYGRKVLRRIAAEAPRAQAGNKPRRRR